MVRHRRYWNLGSAPAIASAGFDHWTAEHESTCRRQRKDGVASLPRDGAAWADRRPEQERSDITPQTLPGIPAPADPWVPPIPVLSEVMPYSSNASANVPWGKDAAFARKASERGMANHHADAHS
jgi:hypothetical protein